MYPSQHFILGLILSIVVQSLFFPGVGIIALIFFVAATVLIDVDHYLIYVWRKGSLNFKKAYDYYDPITAAYRLGKPKNSEGPLMIFHTVEFLAVLIYLTTFNIYFMFIAAGVVFHWLLDVYFMYAHNQLHERTYSLLDYFLRYSKH